MSTTVCDGTASPPRAPWADDVAALRSEIASLRAEVTELKARLGRPAVPY